MNQMRAAEFNALSATEFHLTSLVNAVQAQVEPHFLFNTLANVRGVDLRGHGDVLAALANFVAFASISSRFLSFRRIVLAVARGRA